MSSPDTFPVSVDVLVSETLDFFLSKERLPFTLTRLINHNRIFMNDPVFEIVHICLSSTTCITYMDKGVAFFNKDSSLCLPYKSMLADELQHIIKLLQQAWRQEAFYLNQQRGGGLCLYLRVSNQQLIPHLDVLRAVACIVRDCNIPNQQSKRHILNILCQRFDKALKIDKHALRQLQIEITPDVLHGNMGESALGI